MINVIRRACGVSNECDNRPCYRTTNILIFNEIHKYIKVYYNIIRKNIPPDSFFQL